MDFILYKRLDLVLQMMMEIPLNFLTQNDGNPIELFDSK